MNINDIIKEIAELPLKFYNVGNKSIFSLLKDSGYFEVYEKIDEQDIYRVIVQHPEFIKEWLLWSENKRTDTGWYFRQDNEGKYIVGYFSNSSTSQSEYSDASLACAAFIKHEIEDIRSA